MTAPVRNEQPDAINLVVKPEGTCATCYQIERYLKNLGAPFTTTVVDPTDPDHEGLKQELIAKGVTQMPLVQYKDTVFSGGLDPDTIRTMVEQWASDHGVATNGRGKVVADEREG